MRFLRSVLLLCIIIIVFISSFYACAFNLKFYQREFKKYNIYNAFPDIEESNIALIGYLKGRGEINRDVYNEKEAAHLQDVKKVINKVKLVYLVAIILGALIICLIYFMDKVHFRRNLGVILFFGGLGSVVITLLILGFIYFNFSDVFSLFHNIFFPQGGFLFSFSDNIIKMYPSGFFYDMGEEIFYSAFFYGNILIGVGILLLR
jgi:integral membrane protein (TIGR01906 family)